MNCPCLFAAEMALGRRRAENPGKKSTGIGNDRAEIALGVNGQDIVQ